MPTLRNQFNRLVEQLGLGPRHQTLAELSVGSGTGVMRYAYPLPACCLLIACSGVLVTIFILNEMRLNYSPIRAGFAYKTTEQLWHWRALLRGIVCSRDDAFLVPAELLVPVKCCGSWAKLRARQLRKLVRRHARVVAGPCAWAGARRVARCTARLRSTLRGQSPPSCAHCCVRMRIRCTGLPIPVATRRHS